jgi:hypothetical protein
MTSNEKIMAGVGLIGLGVIIIIFGPLVTIWSWNQLFGDIKMIEYSFWNWLAVIVLGVFFRGTSVSGKISRNK